MNMDDLFSPQGTTLTVLSFGGGQDSSALLEMYLDNAQFRETYAPGDFLVVMSDTGDEFDQTYQHVADVKARCEKAGVEFVFITADMGYHSEGWQSLRHFYRRNQTIGSRCFPKTCTDRLKIQPIYRFLEAWVSEKYGVQCNKKQGIREFAATHGKIRMMIGIAKGEEKRTSDPANHSARWYRDSIEHCYPLIDLGMDRAACQDLLHSKGLRVIPSNCKACPFLSLEELEYLRRFEPDALEDWVALEAAKLQKHESKNRIPVLDDSGNPVMDKKTGQPKVQNKNFGVFGVKPLSEKITEAATKFKAWSDEEIAHYRYSHGHCTATTF